MAIYVEVNQNRSHSTNMITNLSILVLYKKSLTSTPDEVSSLMMNDKLERDGSESQSYISSHK